MNANCTNTIGSYKCTCYRGFTGNGKSCVDIDECELAPCKPLVNCTNLPGSYRCDACPQSFLIGGVCEGEWKLSSSSLYNILCKPVLERESCLGRV